jgi:uncharacterized protein YjbJ (UPF0337 family)
MNIRSSRHDKAAGKADTIAGRILEAFGRLTGNRSSSAKGKAARGRGWARSRKGEAKRRGR